jgi:hypothetical protein
LTDNVKELESQAQKYRNRILEIEKFYLNEMDVRETKINEITEKLSQIKKDHDNKLGIEVNKANRERRFYATEA